MFCCVLKSSLPATSFPARTFRGNILSEKYERHLIFHAGSGDGTAWQGAWEKWLDRKTRVCCSSEFHRNPDTDSQIGLRSGNPGIFVLLRGGRKRNFLVSKGGYINTLWLSAELAPFWTEHKSRFPTSKSCRGEGKPELFDDGLRCALPKPAFL